LHPSDRDGEAAVYEKEFEMKIKVHRITSKGESGDSILQQLASRVNRWHACKGRLCVKYKLKTYPPSKSNKIAKSIRLGNSRKQVQERRHYSPPVIPGADQVLGIVRQFLTQTRLFQQTDG
jgi:hypothetical protein